MSHINAAVPQKGAYTIKTFKFESKLQKDIEEL